MKLIGRSALLAFLLIGSVFGITGSVGAATVTLALTPGRLAITDAPTALVYTPATPTNEARAYAATFSVAITDATGSRAGWRIQAALGPVLDSMGMPAFISASTITDATITTQTGRAPLGAFAYPRPFRTDGDTLFSAAAGSGVGKSSLAFTTELRVPADSPESDQYNAALAVTILSGP